MLQVLLKNMKFFYMEDCCGITNSISSEMKEAIYRLRKHLEVTYGHTVQKVCNPDRRLHRFLRNLGFPQRENTCCRPD